MSAFMDILRSGGNGGFVVHAFVVYDLHLSLKFFHLLFNRFFSLQEQLIPLVKGGIPFFYEKNKLFDVSDGHTRTFKAFDDLEHLDI